MAVILLDTSSLACRQVLRQPASLCYCRRISASPGVRGITGTLLMLTCADQLIRPRTMKTGVRSLPDWSVTAVGMAIHGHDFQGVGVDTIRNDRTCARKFPRRRSVPA